MDYNLQLQVTDHRRRPASHAPAGRTSQSLSILSNVWVIPTQSPFSIQWLHQKWYLAEVDLVMKSWCFAACGRVTMFIFTKTSVLNVERGTFSISLSITFPSHLHLCMKCELKLIWKSWNWYLIAQITGRRLKTRIPLISTCPQARAQPPTTNIPLLLSGSVLPVSQLPAHRFTVSGFSLL